MTRRWAAADLPEYDRATRSDAGFVEVGPKLARRGRHKSPYLYRACAYATALEIPEPVGEFYFADDREWRLDLAWPEQKIAIEVDGGIFIRGAHSRGAGIERDQDKHNAALLAGWRIIRTTPRGLAKAIQMVGELLK